MGHADARVRSFAVVALAEVAEKGNPFAIDLVVGRLEDLDRDVRIAAVAALATIAVKGDAAAINAVVGRFEDEDEDASVRRTAVDALAEIAVEGNTVAWPVNSNARTREKAKEISKSRIPNFPNFLGLVLGCIEAKFCK